jgi:hypothetical protein
MPSYSAIYFGLTGPTLISAGQIPVWTTLPDVPRMNAWTGAGSIFALFGNYYRHAWIEEPQADTLAILRDWVTVGRDIRHAMEKFEAQTGAKPNDPAEPGRYRIVPSESQQLELF